MGELHSIEDIIGMVESEGLSYTVRYYAHSSQIEDPELRDAWQKANDGLNAVAEILEQHGLNEDDE